MTYEVQVPRINANEDEVLLAQLLVTVGSYVLRNAEVATIESSKSAHSVEAGVDGWVTAVHAAEGDVVAVGSVLISLGSGEHEPATDDIREELPAVGETMARQTAKERLKNKQGGSVSKNVAPIQSLFMSQPSDQLDWVQAARLQLQQVEPTVHTFVAKELRIHFPNAEIGEGATVRAQRIHIGTGAKIGNSTTIDADDVFLGDGVSIGKNTEIVTGELVVADGATIGDAVLIDLAGGKSIESRLLAGPVTLIGGRAHINTSREVVLESEAALSPGAMVFTHSFWQSALDGYPVRFGRVRLAHRSWVGAACQVLPGVIVGSGSVAVSNSTLVENVPPHVMVAGIPATVIRSNLGLKASQASKQAVLMARLDEFWQWMTNRGCSVASNESGATVTLLDKTVHNIVVLSASDDVSSVPKNSVVLTFGPRPEQAFAILDLVENVALGSENSLVHSLRNFLRRMGVRLAPYSWRPDYRKEI